jgi:DNA-binding NarL/FixJ family response regulator
MHARIKVLTVDDHPLFRRGVAAVLGCEPDMEIVAEADNGHEAIDQFKRFHPDIVLMDLRMPSLGGVEAIAVIRAHDPLARILVLTTYEGDVEAQRALRAGARGYLLKSTVHNELIDAIHQLMAGHDYVPAGIAAGLAARPSSEELTAREIAVLTAAGQGNGNREIARMLAISDETVKTHLKHIFAKLGASDRTHAVRIGVRLGVIVD